MPKKAKNSGAAKQVVSYRHDDKRVNNPEVGMVHADTDVDGEKTEWQYDPHLDPTLNFDHARAGIEKIIDDALESEDPEKMKAALAELKRMQEPYLNWSGKAENTSFEIDTVSLHVHERIDPASILASVSKRVKGKAGATAWQQPDLFSAPFENLPLRQAVDFYQHEKGWSNRLVTGDSLLVMNSLLTKESMGGKVQMIYIDPPYGIKYGSNFQPFTNKRDVKDGADADLTQEPEMIKAFRDTWELGIHSYLSYLRDRLLLARDLLHETGSIFVQISDENLNFVQSLLGEVFGPENQIAIITLKKTAYQASATLANVTDYIVWYAKSKKKVKIRQVFNNKEQIESFDLFKFSELENGEVVKSSHSDATSAGLFQLISAISQGSGSKENTFNFQGKKYSPPENSHWKTTLEGMYRLGKQNRLVESGSSIRWKGYVRDFPVSPINNIWTDVMTGSFTDPKIYVVQTNTKIIERCMLMTTDPGDLTLDPTCGSGVTAFVAEHWGRRWITCDTSRVAVTLAKQRLMTASFDYFSLRYPDEGIKGGFDYDTVPHITLKSIANNPDIDTIYDEEHPKIEAALNNLNSNLTSSPPAPIKPARGVRKGEEVNFSNGDTLYEWEVPFDWLADWPEEAKEPFDNFHKARQAMQKRMDQSIADHADQETLYDKPKIDKERLRITGPFSVEAVPAPTVPTVLSIDEVSPPSEADASIARSGETSRQSAWRDELLKTGVRAKGGEIMQFAEFETLPSCRFIHASGSVADTGDRVVVSFGPEHAALEQRQVEEAMSEAYNLVPKPKFVLFCAFTFDPEAAKDIDEMQAAGITLLKAQMNTDLLTEDLKKSRSSNQSFWLMGQPEVEVRKRTDGQFEVEVHGFDYFNPKSGEVESGGTKQIAMWSLDTDYDQRSLMPHQVFFPMADNKSGWNRLKKTIRAELDEELLEKFRGTVSLPFGAGENKRVAVKIVDDRGIESLKIVSLED